MPDQELLLPAHLCVILAANIDSVDVHVSANKNRNSRLLPSQPLLQISLQLLTADPDHNMASQFVKQKGKGHND